MSTVLLSVYVHHVTVSISGVVVSIDHHSALHSTVAKTLSLLQLMTLYCYYQYWCKLLRCCMPHCDTGVHVSTAADAAAAAAIGSCEFYCAFTATSKQCAMRTCLINQQCYEFSDYIEAVGGSLVLRSTIYASISLALVPCCCCCCRTLTAVAVACLVLSLAAIAAATVRCIAAPSAIASYQALASFAALTLLQARIRTVYTQSVVYSLQHPFKYDKAIKQLSNQQHASQDVPF
eukprot:635-Heterococcus_DN1.PRE.1